MTNAERVREMRKETGLSAQKFGDKYGIPMRTIQDWERGERNAPDYVIDLLERAVEEDKAQEVFKRYDAGSVADEHDCEARIDVHGRFRCYNDVAAAFNLAEDPDELYTGVDMTKEHRGGYLFIYDDGATMLFL